jgi:AcrR family transcriptional regulator
MNVHSFPDDRTARARIRDEALRLFGERGPDAVPLREIAAAAGVSAALVVRHYGGKDALRAAVDTYVTQVLEGLLAQVTRSAGGGLDPSALPGLLDDIAANLPAGSAIPAYLGRLLTSRGAAGSAVFHRLYEASKDTLAAMASTGTATAGDDPEVRAAVLLVNDLGVLILRHRIAEVLGIDPISTPGMERWATEVLTIYRDGLGTTTDQLHPKNGGNDVR